ncbi:MAG: hypothetical protein IJ240_02335 [Clostridia bacterium]|nr:hypothetical protein [Clostridia bacterium]
MDEARKKRPRPAPPIDQDTVDAMSAARTMDELLAIAQARGVDWNSFSDEWLTAIAEGDVTGLLNRFRHGRA